MTSADPGGRQPLLGFHRRGLWLLPLLLVVLAGLTFVRLRDPSHTDIVELNGLAMGTTWFVKVVAPDATPEQRDEMHAAIRRELDLVNRLMSTWDPGSELSKFNASQSTEDFSLSAPSLEVFELSLAVGRQTAGAFDVTVGPAVRAWGFGAGSDPVVLDPPGESTLAALRERVGYHNLSIDPEAETVHKRHPGTQVDLSGVAKGYAVDRIARTLEKLGWPDVLVELGGELGARGTRGTGNPWRVAVERPGTEGRSIFAIVELRDAGMATSGDYRSFYVRDGVRLSHLIDPRTLRPIAHSVASVSVIDPGAARADALATGLGVLGLEDGLALAEREQIAAYFIVREPGDTLRGVASSHFEPFLAERQPTSETANR